MIVDRDAFQQAVDAHYESLYRFALSMTHQEAEARDLTQEAFHRLATHGWRLRDPSKMKTWLFTTLYRRFVSGWRRQSRFPQVELGEVGADLPATEPTAADQLDARIVRQALDGVDEVYRVPLILFYLEEHSYLEIAEILKIPCGTVMSRISRGRAQLRALLADKLPPKTAPGKAPEPSLTPSPVV